MQQTPLSKGPSSRAWRSRGSPAPSRHAAQGSGMEHSHMDHGIPAGPRGAQRGDSEGKGRWPSRISTPSAVCSAGPSACLLGALEKAQNHSGPLGLPLTRGRSAASSLPGSLGRKPFWNNKRGTGTIHHGAQPRGLGSNPDTPRTESPGTDFSASVLSPDNGEDTSIFHGVVGKQK